MRGVEDSLVFSLRVGAFDLGDHVAGIHLGDVAVERAADASVQRDGLYPTRVGHGDELVDALAGGFRRALQQR